MKKLSPFIRKKHTHKSNLVKKEMIQEIDYVLQLELLTNNPNHNLFVSFCLVGWFVVVKHICQTIGSNSCQTYPKTSRFCGYGCGRIRNHICHLGGICCVRST